MQTLGVLVLVEDGPCGLGVLVGDGDAVRGGFLAAGAGPAAAGRRDGHAAHGGQQAAHEFAAAVGAGLLRGRVALVLVLDAQLDLFQVRDRQELQVDFGEEVALVVGHEDGELPAQGLEVLKRRVGAHAEFDLLLQLLGARDVPDPQPVDARVGDLHQLPRRHLFEHTVQQRDFDHVHVGVVDGDPVADVVGMFDKDGDAGGEQFTGRAGKQERTTRERRPDLGVVVGKVVGEECCVDQDDEDQDEHAQHSVQDLDSVLDVVCAFPNGLAIRSDLLDEIDHFDKRNVAIAIGVDFAVDVHCLSLVAGSEHDFDGLLIQLVGAKIGE